MTLRIARARHVKTPSSSCRAMPGSDEDGYNGAMSSQFIPFRVRKETAVEGSVWRKQEGQARSPCSRKA